MVRGLNRFAAHFAAYQDRYVLIGGAALFVAMENAGLEFRVTKDLDIVLCLETLDTEFTCAIWDFVRAGGYEIGQRSGGKPTFYRFLNPADSTYPQMIELFARRPDLIEPPAEFHLVPIPVSEEVSSLSAILLEDDYYQFVMAGRQGDSGLSVLAPAYLIPLKAKAWIDLSRRREQGDQAISSNDIKKHRNDILRICQLLSPEARVQLPPRLQADLVFFVKVALSVGAEPKDLRIKGMTLAGAQSLLGAVFSLSGLEQ